MIASEFVSYRYLRNAPSRPDEVLGLDFASSDLTILGAFLDFLYQFLLLVLEFDALSVQFSLCSLESSLMLAQALCWRHTFSESPLDDLTGARLSGEVSSDCG